MSPVQLVGRGSRIVGQLFPFPHLLALTVGLFEQTFTARTAVTPTGDHTVPLCFGFHPLFAVAGPASGAI
jgi:aldose 1-epimerase